MPTRVVGHAQLPIDQIHNNPDQPRKTFDTYALKALQGSLTQRGLINPISVVQRTEGGYLLIAGERRFRAAQALGWKDIEARIWPAKTPVEEIEKLAVVENLQRQDLDPMEEALAYKTLTNAPANLTQREIARLVGKSQTIVARTLSFLDQSDAVQDLIRRRIILTAHIVSLNRITDITDRTAWAVRTGKEGWSSRELERRIKQFLGKTAPGKFPAHSYPETPKGPTEPSQPAGSLLPKSAVDSVEPVSDADFEALVQAAASGGSAAIMPPEMMALLPPDIAAPMNPASSFPSTAGTLFKETLGPSIPETPAPDPLETCWTAARQIDSEGIAFKTRFAADEGWTLIVRLPKSDERHARAALSVWLQAFGRQVQPELLASQAPAPAAPRILEATYGNGHRLELRWTSNGEGFSYRLYRSPEDDDHYEKLQGGDVTSTGATVDCDGGAYKWFRLAVIAIDPQGRESELSQTVRFDLNGLNHSDSVQPL